jgi:hypothetical protein
MNDENLKNDEAATERGDAILKRMLKTPPKQHKEMKKGRRTADKRPIVPIPISEYVDARVREFLIFSGIDPDGPPHPDCGGL